MKVHIRRRVRFSAAHSYENIPDDVFQSGRELGLKRRSVHGHNFTVDLACSGELDPRTGMVVNITDVDRVLKGLLMPLHESFLERDHPAVAWGIPSTENLAIWIWRACEGRIPGAQLERVRVWEDDFLWSDYMGDSRNTVFVTRAYEFAAAHRLHSPLLSDERLPHLWQVQQPERPRAQLRAGGHRAGPRSTPAAGWRAASGTSTPW
jgi:6-pyruvoyl-tetrahydropterin synthase